MFGRSGAAPGDAGAQGSPSASTAHWEGPRSRAIEAKLAWLAPANFSELPCSILASARKVLPARSSSPIGALERARGPCYMGQHNKPAQGGHERRPRAREARRTSAFSRLRAARVERASETGHPVRWRAWRRKSPCVGVVPEGDSDRAPARANPFIDEPSDATDSSSLETTFFDIEGDRFSLKASPSCHNNRAPSPA